MASAGRILIIPKGTWDATKTYENLDLVTHNQRAWLAKKVSVGIEPSEENAEYWHDFLGTALTAETVGALPIEGGTLDGSFYINGKHGHLSANETEMLMVHYPDKTNMSKFEYLALNGKEDLKNILRVNRIGASGLEMYRIYGEHNKPTAEDVGALPGTGGYVRGPLGIINDEVFTEMRNADNRMYLRTSDGTDENYRDMVFGLDLEPSYAVMKDGTYNRYKLYGEHNKPTASDVGASSIEEVTKLKSDLTKYLPLTGGTLSGSLFGINNGTGLFFDNGSAMTVIAKDDSSNKREFRLRHRSDTSDVSKSLILRELANGAEKDYNLFGEYNKPSGTYIGNASATARTINVGGLNSISSLLAIYSQSSGAFLLVMENGALCFYGGITTTFKQTEVNFTNGVLRIASAHDHLNMNGRTFEYRLL